MRMHFVIDTHIHADHLSVASALRPREARQPFVFGERGTSFLFKPGTGRAHPWAMSKRQCSRAQSHARHICLLVSDRTRAEEVWFVLTGHTLMVGDLGRTELAATAAQRSKGTCSEAWIASGAAGLR